MVISTEQLNAEILNKIGIQKRKKGNPGNRLGYLYKDCICAFDIESTTIDEIQQAIMYIWQLQIDDLTVIGRTWQEFLQCIAKLCSVCNDKEYFVIFVHNLSYEFQFLRGIYNFTKEEVFAVDSRKILKCTMFNHIEFRCSYLHSNMSLSEYTEKMKAEHRKLDGEEFDYSIKRYQWTELTTKELEYCINDVLGLVESIRNEMEHDGDNLYTFPLTSTGYVRRDAKRAMKKISPWFVKNQLADFRIYSLCREAFRGGDTHANRYYAGKVLHGVKSADRSSSYPDVLCNCQFPVGEFFYKGDCTERELHNIIYRRHKAVLMRVALSNVELNDPYFGAPYLSKDKCRKIENAIIDNGRILKADYLETTITDIDYIIISKQYKWTENAFFDVAFAKYGDLPKPLIEEIIKYYVAKTELKGIEEQEVFYTKSKNKLNSIYGMMAQDPVKQTIDFMENEFIKRNENPEEILDKANKKAFLCYQWGVWCTAWARYRLQEGIELAGDNFVYCDTDSVKYVGEIDWSEYNKDRINDSIRTGAYATDSKGVTHYMGVYEPDGEYYEFSTLGAKKYCYTYNKDGDIHTTIAGVNKKKGGNELKKYGGISAFKEGFIFIDAGGTESIYNDTPNVDTYTIDGHPVNITSNIVIKPSTYTLGITADYERLLKNPNIFIDFK